MDKLSDQQRDDALERPQRLGRPRARRSRAPSASTTSRTRSTSSNAVAEMAEDGQPPPRHRHPLQQGHDQPDDAQRRRSHAQRHRAGRGHRRRRRRLTRRARAPAASAGAAAPPTCYTPIRALVAQGIRARASGARGRRFESFRGHQRCHFDNVSPCKSQKSAPPVAYPFAFDLATRAGGGFRTLTRASTDDCGVSPTPRGRLTGMPVLALLYPSTSLAELADPLAVGAGRGRDVVLHDVAQEIEQLLGLLPDDSLSDDPSDDN